MSFSSQIKEKLCKSEYGCMNCAAYELSGALMFGGNIGSDSIKFATENENIAKRITADINTAYGIQVETQVISKVQRIIIDNIYQVENITGGISQSDDIPFSCCRASFVRGAFLGGGSVTDPQKGYHMEFNTKSDEQALRLQKLLKNEGFNSKITYRKGIMLFISRVAKKLRIYSDIWARHKERLNCFRYRLKKKCVTKSTDV